MKGLLCPHCNSEALEKIGTIDRAGKLHQRYRCRKCGYKTYRPISTELEPRIARSVSKVLESTRITKVKE